jgi:AAHS family 4-hydroxybenzoate transporter-like MFS transporter
VQGETRALAVTEVIDRRPLSRFQITTIALCGLVMVLDGFDTQCIGFLAPAMADTFVVPLKAFGLVFSASLVGLMISSMTMGPVADRWGRKWPVVFSTLTFAIFAILTGGANSINQVVIFRFLTGLGLGGAMPNVVALTSEYAPKRLQHTLVAALFCGMPLGALIGGLASSVMIPLWGWRSVFYLGGILPLVVALILIKALPESIRFLAVRGGDSRQIAKIMARVAPELTDVPVSSLIQTEGRREGLPVKRLFTEGRAFGTILLWIPYFMNLLILYFIVSWLPALLRQASMPISAGVTAISMFSLGGIVGSLVQGRLMNGFGPYLVMLVEFILSTLLIGSLAFLGGSFGLTMTVTFILGISVQGSQGGLSALAASFYPTAIRSTGIGWGLGIGRMGSIIGPLLGGILLKLDWSAQQIFLAGVIPSLCAGIAVMLSGFRGSATTYHSAPDPDRADAA